MFVVELLVIARNYYSYENIAIAKKIEFNKITTRNLRTSKQTKAVSRIMSACVSTNEHFVRL